jgi:hypothetical protein
VASAIVLGGGYVASRAVPGLFQNVQVFGGEGGGRAVAADPGKKTRPAIIPSTKSGAIADNSGIFTADAIISSSKSGPVFTPSAPPAVPKTSRTVQSRKLPARQAPRRVILSDGTVIELPSETSGPTASSSVSSSSAGNAQNKPAGNAPNRPRPQRAPNPSQQPAKQYGPQEYKPQQVQPPQRPEIMAGSKSAAIILYQGSR